MIKDEVLKTIKTYNLINKGDKVVVGVSGGPDSICLLHVLYTLKQELGIEISINNIIDTFVVNRRNKSLLPYYDVYFEIDNYTGELKINEPEKCSELVWSDINNLPEDMIDFEIEAIKNNQKGVKFSTIDTNNEKRLVLK